jgi:argininosuccinate lyase
MAKLWETAAGKGGLDPEIEVFLSSADDDRRILAEDLAGSRAHAAMIGRQGIIPAATAATLDEGLAGLAAEAEAGRLVFDGSSEDVHSFVEAALTERYGDAGRSLHAGRSRNDQVALDLRLWLRSASRETRLALAGLIETICGLAEGHTTTIMPGYTHLQRAQPVTFAHHLLAWCAALERDLGRYEDADARADESPLGACALAGSGLPLDPASSAAALGFSRPCRNSMDAVAERDALVEFAAASATLLMHLSRYCEEIVLWASAEFGFVKLAPSCSTGSSVMPQKRNPDPAELIRGKAGKAYGALISLLVMEKGLALAYNRDLQECKEAAFDAADTALACLRAFTVLVKALEPDAGRMRKAAEAGCLWAADAAEYLVLRQGVPFRTAYAAGRALVEAWEAAKTPQGLGRSPSTAGLIARLGTKGLAALHPAWQGVDVQALASWLALDACVARRELPGGPAPARARAEIGRLRALAAAAVVAADVSP